jgi:HPt (histidine-containing phosphotransfer) domain-containing protein
MQTDIDHWEDALEEEIASTRQMLDSLPNVSDPLQRGKVLDKAEKTLKSAAGSLRSFKMEARLVARTSQQRSQYEGLLKQRTQELQALQDAFNSLQSKEDRGKLFISRKSADADNDATDPTRVGSTMLNEAGHLQECTAASLTNTRRMIANSKEIGTASLEKLKDQREAIRGIDKSTDRADDNLARSEKLIAVFGRRMSPFRIIRGKGCSRS